MNITQTLDQQLHNKILLWDNDGTISSTINPSDDGPKEKVILPNVKNFMLNAKLNFIISGCKTAESELQNFDPEQIIARFSELMQTLPISAATFSPAIGGVACYCLIKTEGSLVVKLAHTEPRYAQYITKFKKPDIGMFAVIRDIAIEFFDQDLTSDNTIMIGDTWHDKEAAGSFGVKFVDAKLIHNVPVA